MTEEPQLGSIQERIAALKQAQQGPEPPLFRPVPERCKSANNPPSYNVTGSVLDGASIGNEPAPKQSQRPVPRPPSTQSSPPVKPKKAPPPLPTRKSGQPPPPPARPAARPELPSRRPTEPLRRPSRESTTSDASLSTTTSVGRGTSTTSLDSNGGNRIKAPAWDTTERPPLPARREAAAETNGRASISNLSSNVSARGPSPSPPSLPARREPREDSNGEATPRLPPRPLPRGDTESNGTAEDSSAFSGFANASSAVKDLLPKNFDQVVLKSGKPALVEFFAPWCGYCKMLDPVYEELAQTFAHAEDKVTIAKVDAAEHADLGKRFDIQGFPTLKWFDGKSAEPQEYNGGRDLESLSSFITEKTNIRPRGAAKELSNLRRLPPPSSDVKIKDPRECGFGGMNNARKPPPRPNSTPTEHPTPGSVPPPVPRDTRPNLSKIQATKPRFHASVPSISKPSTTSDTVCLVCRDFSGPDTHATRYPRASLPTQDLAWLANELTAPFPSLTDKARVIFTWLHHNIFYNVDDFYNNCIKPSTPASTLSTGLAVCEGYAALFAALATHAGLEAIVVSGHGKGYGHEQLAPGSPVPPFSSNHAWNAVRIDGGQWKLIDTCWGSGHVEGKNMPYKQQFNPSEFYKPNDEFGLKHFPTNKDQFFRDDGRPSISWEEYILTNPDQPDGLQPVFTWSSVDEHSIGRRTIRPSALQISVYSTAGPLRFQFGLLCPHWTLSRHSRIKPSVFLLEIHGMDGRKDDRLPFNHVPGSGPGGGGEFWYVDVPDARMLGAPGQKVQLLVLNSIGNIEDARGVTVDEYKAQVGRTGMSWSGIAQWELVR